MAEKFFVIFERVENGSKEIAGQAVGSVKVSASKPANAAYSETSAHWSGSVELAKIVHIEAESAAEARQAVQAMFPGSATTPAISVLESGFLETEA